VYRDSPAGLAPGRRTCHTSLMDKDKARIEAYENRMRRIASELSLAEARERREIASDLHDHIGQALAFAAQKLSVLRGNSIFSGMDDDFDEILSILRQAISYTRDLTVEISPPVLYELGLPAAIDWLAERTTARHGLPVKMSNDGEPAELGEDLRVFIFKTVQELINNVIKHAEASKVEIRSSWKDEGFEIEVRDDGRGFDPETFERDSSDSCCFGLFNIRERLSYLGGTFTIDSSPGAGTRVTVTAPYRVTERNGDG
jgi:signal transduction histidine kinase